MSRENSPNFSGNTTTGFPAKWHLNQIHKFHTVDPSVYLKLAWTYCICIAIMLAYEQCTNTACTMIFRIINREAKMFLQVHRMQAPYSLGYIKINVDKLHSQNSWRNLSDSVVISQLREIPVGVVSILHAEKTEFWEHWHFAYAIPRLRKTRKGNTEKFLYCTHVQWQYIFHNYQGQVSSSGVHWDNGRLGSWTKVHWGGGGATKYLGTLAPKALV